MSIVGNLAEKMDDVLWTLSGIPGYISLEVKSSMLAHKMIKEEKKAQKEKSESTTDFREVDTSDLKNEKKETKNEIKKALDSINYDANCDPEFIKRINEICEDNNALKVVLVAKATNTAKWIQYGFYYLTDPDAKLVPVLEDKTKELLNGLATMFGFSKIYESAGIADLEKFDPNSSKFNIKLPYFLSLKEINENAKAYIVQMEDRKEQFRAEAEHPEDDQTIDDFSSESKTPTFTVDNEKIIHPIFFTKKEAKTDESWVKHGNGISDEMFKKLENNLSEFLDGTEYRYEACDNGLINLFIKRKIIAGYAQDLYTIDPGIVMGKDKFYILGKIPGDTIFVSVDHKSIVRNILESKFYTLYPNEIQEVAMDYFHNNNIYRYMDMSNTGFLNNLDQDSYQKLGKKLTFIINQLKSLNDGITDIPRFRFDKFKSVDEFSIISDDKTKSPLKDTNETSSVINSGLKFEVSGDNVTQKLNDLSINYKIDKYGEI